MKYFMNLWLAFLIAFTPLAGSAKTLTSIYADNLDGMIAPRNYLGAKGDFEDQKGFTGWAAYKDAAGTSPVDGTGGSPTLTCTRTTSSPIDGDGSLLITKPASNVQGEGCSVPFTIPQSAKGKMITLNAELQLASGSYTDNSAKWYVYDVTNGTIIEPVPTEIKQGSGVWSSPPIEFPSNYNSTSYRLIYHYAATDTTAFTMKLDQMKLGRVQSNRGPPVTDVKTGVCTSSWVTNSTTTCKYRQDGDHAYIEWNIALSGAPNNTGLVLGLPAGLTLDTSKITGSGTNQFQQVGKGIVTDASGPGSIPILTMHNNGTLYAGYQASGGGGIGGLSSTSPVTFATGDQVYLTAWVPIAGWSSGVVYSSDAGTRPVVMTAFQASTFTAATSGYVDMAFDTVLTDTHSKMSGATYTFPEGGEFEVSADACFPATTTNSQQYNMRVVFTGLSSGTTDLDVYTTTSTTSNYPKLHGSIIRTVRTGDTVKIQIAAPTITTSNIACVNQIKIRKYQGPQQIAASESVIASYGQSASVSYGTSGVLQTVTYDTKFSDSSSGMNSGTGIFSAPSSGEYQACGDVYSMASAGTTAGVDVVLNIGTTAKYFRNGPNVAAATGFSTTGCFSGPLLKGQTIYMQARCYYSSGTCSMNNGLIYSGSLTIRRVGN